MLQQSERANSTSRLVSHNDNNNNDNKNKSQSLVTRKAMTASTHKSPLLIIINNREVLYNWRLT